VKTTVKHKAPDPCAQNPCDPNAQCTATGGTNWNCACLVGYSGNGLSCTEIDGCAAKPCDPQATCRKTGPGKFSCNCNDGYIANGNKCDKVIDHTAEEQKAAIDKALDELQKLQEKKTILP